MTIGMKKLSSKTLKKVYNRHYQLLGCFNYERQMSTGYAWTMMPAIRELYAYRAAKPWAAPTSELYLLQRAILPEQRPRDLGGLDVSILVGIRDGNQKSGDIGHGKLLLGTRADRTLPNEHHDA